ncbi:putative transcriptional regulatory protein, LuxR family [Bradyrhizobium sp. ORS 285]|uniref:response regulator transcription factor n=1 Tax=Bradyrhizobium sp. ORS 285 TaxID=115808 RepID=UPI000240A682|nr:helix-turn-helix transcriptional regulator [Bradyrhizobium sp. ORS 285]CCD89355.1 putative transcriptional regulatory protein, LuxR family [Bradyrhizobium sp. ORS 285]SMX58609.1 putative transcriptional regulatory protein, LuxR family [Bradyrhizobium sp. ORS 285]
MSADDIAPITIAIAVGDAELADRLAALLGGVAGLRLVAPGESADVAVIAPSSGDAGENDADRNQASDAFQLTARERDVLALMAEGCSNKEIARSLGISVHTAKFHVGSLLDKLDATGRTDAVAHAARRGIIEL